MFRSVLSVFLGFVLMMMLVMTYQMGLWMTTDIFPTPEQIESGDIPTTPIAINCVLLIIDLLIGLFGGYFTKFGHGNDLVCNATFSSGTHVRGHWRALTL